MLELKQLLKELPICPLRLGRVWDDAEGKYRCVITCGGKREVTLDICQSCGGFDKPLVKEYKDPTLIDNS